jgi:hypothetical protein
VGSCPILLLFNFVTFYKIMGPDPTVQAGPEMIRSDLIIQKGQGLSDIT